MGPLWSRLRSPSRKRLPVDLLTYSNRNEITLQVTDDGSAVRYDQAGRPRVENGSNSQHLPPLIKLYHAAPVIFKDIYDSLPVEDQKALFSTSLKLGELRNDWLSRNDRRINAELKDSADVRRFCHLMANPALGQFEELRLRLHCDPGREFVVDPDSNVHELRCWFMRSFSGSYCETLRKLSAAFPGVTTLDALCHGTEPFAESEADLSLLWSLQKLYVLHLPISLFTGCSSALTELRYTLHYTKRNAMYRIPSALFDACKNTVEVMEVVALYFRSFKVCDMNDVAKLTKVRELYCYFGARIGNLDMSRMPPTLTSLHNGDQRLI